MICSKFYFIINLKNTGYGESAGDETFLFNNKYLSTFIAGINLEFQYIYVNNYYLLSLIVSVCSNICFFVMIFLMAQYDVSIHIFSVSFFVCQKPYRCLLLSHICLVHVGERTWHSLIIITCYCHFERCCTVLTVNNFIEETN